MFYFHYTVIVMTCHVPYRQHFIYIPWYYVPRPRYDYEERRSGDRINFDHLEFINVHLKVSTRVFLHFAPIKVRTPWPRESHPRPRT